MQRVSGVISVGGMVVNAVADNINSGILDVGDGIGTGTGMVNIILFPHSLPKSKYLIA